ncbi:MAG TPA: hypothetical protein PKN57_05685 [Saprospiraceae bacterium]|nr:hypothetical protein [Saprospiraceae bacterium]MCC6687982.1 hypothetical protein [Saprospiraceae bacterium]HMV24508.1 hypothetical protein [Saprospiraceae bacterium]HMW74339.1 hypothetical protein [Saprospiraceae bacterium]HMX81710.1 hypothetical protein [Saprospiraceae bacterium]
MNKLFITLFTLVVVVLTGCNKDPEIIGGNNPPDYTKISTIKMQNYVNRMFIDLVGREPLDVEMDENVNLLRSNNLSVNARRQIIQKLQNSTDSVFGDGSYRKAYSQYMYNLAKVRTIEGASDEDINMRIGNIVFGMKEDSLLGDWESYNKGLLEKNNLQSILDTKVQFFDGQIPYDVFFSRMVNNSIYDFIHMNTFNFVNSTFEDLLWRFPTSTEFLVGFDIVEYNKPNLFFNKLCTNKKEYVDAICDTNEFFEGMIIWCYRTLLSREPKSQETSEILGEYILNRDIRKIQEKIMITDEYANF